jgi:O-antigen ligase
VYLLAALPASFAGWRLSAPGLGSGLSFADAALAVAVTLAVLKSAKMSEQAVLLFRAVAVYLVILLPAVVAHPTSSAVIDWFHRAFLMMGGLMVGTELANIGLRSKALRWFITTESVISLVAIAQWLASGFRPAYPLGVSKNLAGEILAGCLLASLVLGREIGISRKLLFSSRLILTLGLIATQSRGAWLGLTVALIVFAVRARLRSAYLVLIAAIFVSAATYTLVSLSSESKLQNSQQTSSFDSRRNFETVAYGYFEKSPIVGQGIRYYLDPKFHFPQPLSSQSGTRPSPHDLLLEALSEAGLVGLIAIGTLVILVVRRLSRRPGPFYTLALAAFLGNFTHGLVDIYWLAGSLTVPWIFMGLATGDTTHNDRSEAETSQPSLTN